MDEFINRVLNRFALTITDEVFLLIQNDHELMQDYLRQVHAHGIEEINRSLGFRIKQAFYLENLDEEEHPRSTLIKTYTRHLVR